MKRMLTTLAFAAALYAAGCVLISNSIITHDIAAVAMGGYALLVIVGGCVAVSKAADRYSD